MILFSHYPSRIKFKKKAHILPFVMQHPHVQQGSQTLTCVQILETIEALRNIFVPTHTRSNVEPQTQLHQLSHSYSHSSPIRLSHLAEVSTKVLAVLRDIHSLPSEKILFFEVYKKDISACFAMMLDILEKCRQEVPNHFGVFEVILRIISSQSLFIN